MHRSDLYFYRESATNASVGSENACGPDALIKQARRFRAFYRAKPSSVFCSRSRDSARVQGLLDQDEFLGVDERPDDILIGELAILGIALDILQRQVKLRF